MCCVLNIFHISSSGSLLKKRVDSAQDTYPYWHQEKRGLDFDGMMAGISKMQDLIGNWVKLTDVLSV